MRNDLRSRWSNRCATEPPAEIEAGTAPPDCFLPKVSAPCRTYNHANLLCLAIMRLMLINPNTTVAITEKVAAEARRIGGPGIDIIPVTGRFGARYIASRAAYAVAAHAALDAFAACAEPHDAVMLGCFGDPGLDALREISPKPVIGMADASIAAAAKRAGTFSIVTGGERWVAMLEEFVASRGLADRLASVRAVTQTAALKSPRDRTGRHRCRPGCGFEALAGASGRPRIRTCRLVPRRRRPRACLVEAGPVPLIDCVEDDDGIGAPRSACIAACARVESIGLPAALAQRLPAAPYRSRGRHRLKQASQSGPVGDGRKAESRAGIVDEVEQLPDSRHRRAPSGHATAGPPAARAARVHDPSVHDVIMAQRRRRTTERFSPVGREKLMHRPP